MFCSHESTEEHMTSTPQFLFGPWGVETIRNGGEKTYEAEEKEEKDQGSKLPADPFNEWDGETADNTYSDEPKSTGDNPELKRVYRVFDNQKRRLRRNFKASWVNHQTEDCLVFGNSPYAYDYERFEVGTYLDKINATGLFLEDDAPSDSRSQESEGPNDWICDWSNPSSITFSTAPAGRNITSTPTVTTVPPPVPNPKKRTLDEMEGNEAKERENDVKKEGEGEEEEDEKKTRLLEQKAKQPPRKRTKTKGAVRTEGVRWDPPRIKRGKFEPDAEYIGGKEVSEDARAEAEEFFDHLCNMPLNLYTPIPDEVKNQNKKKMGYRASHNVFLTMKSGYFGGFGRGDKSYATAANGTFSHKRLLESYWAGWIIDRRYNPENTSWGCVSPMLEEIYGKDAKWPVPKIIRDMPEIEIPPGVLTKQQKHELKSKHMHDYAAVIEKLLSRGYGLPRPIDEEKFSARQELLERAKQFDVIEALAERRLTKIRKLQKQLKIAKQDRDSHRKGSSSAFTPKRRPSHAAQPEKIVLDPELVLRHPAQTDNDIILRDLEPSLREIYSIQHQDESHDIPGGEMGYDGDFRGGGGGGDDVAEDIFPRQLKPLLPPSTPDGKDADPNNGTPRTKAIVKLVEQQEQIAEQQGHLVDTLEGVKDALGQLASNKVPSRPKPSRRLRNSSNAASGGDEDKDKDPTEAPVRNSQPSTKTKSNKRRKSLDTMHRKYDPEEKDIGAELDSNHGVLRNLKLLCRTFDEGASEARIRYIGNRATGFKTRRQDLVPILEEFVKHWNDSKVSTVKVIRDLENSLADKR